MIDPKYTKPVSSVVSAQSEITTDVTLTGNSLQFSFANRTDSSTKMGNYFSSFNLPHRSDNFPDTKNLSLLYPEMQQLNTNKIIIIKIPNTGYSEFIDARSVELKIPINQNGTGTTTGVTYYSLFSSTYSSDLSLKYGETSPLLGDNISYLFTDSINPPYTGVTYNELGKFISHSANTTWNSRVGLQNRPSAVSYLEVQGNIDAINTDRRMRRHQSTKVFSNYPAKVGTSADFPETEFIVGALGLYVPVGHGFKVGDTVTIDMDSNTINTIHNGITTISSITYNYTVPSYVTGGTYDLIVTNKAFGVSSYLECGSIFLGRGTFYNYDIPVGFVCLDKGIIVITHKDIVDNFSWSGGTDQNGNALTGTSDASKYNIYFNDQNVFLKYTDINTEFTTTAVCMALNGEFYISNNRTWDRDVALATYGGYNPIHITEIGLYNGLGELVGMAKMSEPVERNMGDIMTFSINIEM